MKARTFTAVACVLSVGFCSAAVAADGWKMPSLIPFKKSEASPRTTASITDEPESRGLPKIPVPELPKISVPKMSVPKLKMPKMQLPDWLPGTGKSAASKPRHRAPSTWDKMNQGSKEFWGRTQEILMPWSIPKRRPSHPTRATSKKGTFLGMSLPWTDDQEQPEVKTVQDFMALDRLK